MSSIDYEQVASVLDAVADYVDGIEHAKTAAETSARTERIEKLATQYSTSTGEALPETMQAKLAGLDQETLDHLLRVANNTGESPTALGHSADIADDPAPRTVKEAADQAGDNFLNWINS